MSNVIAFIAPAEPVASAIQGAIDADLTAIAILGTDHNGDTYMDAAGLDCATLLYLVERLKLRLLDHA